MKYVALSVVTLAAVLMGVGSGMAAGPSSAEVGTLIAVPGGSYHQIGPPALKMMLAQKAFTFVNVHIPYEGEIAQTDVHVPYDQVAQLIARFPADRNAKIVLYCRTGHMSRIAAEALVRLGYTNVWDLVGGFEGWKGAGFPWVSR